ncbi:MAG TPA: Hsp20/alpha crystallin family protein, partial [Nitrospiria bacterium]|nr:Hsp20/alpha crystallin family protein [Nitrospiria bacterium]
AEMPGVKLEDVSLQIKNDILTLSGIRHFSKETKKENYHRIERSYGTFSRSFSLPGSVDQSGIQAKLKDGLLEVRLPKADTARENPIPIEIRKS